MTESLNTTTREGGSAENAGAIFCTENLSTLALAVQNKSTSGRGSGKKIDLYGIKKLRELILELAVRGKLVAQNPEDEPASKLLERIEIEKARLLKEKLIKKPKKLPVISDDEKPYGLPAGWEWQRLSDVFYPISVSNNKIKTSEVCEQGDIPVVDQGQSFITGYTDRAELEILLPGPVIVFGDHTSALKYIDFNFVAGADGVKILRPICSYEKFFFLVCKTLPIENRGYGRHYRRLIDNLFPLPPLVEQHRIVTKVDELMALCDQIGQQTEASLSAHTTLVENLLATLTSSANAEELKHNWQRIASHFTTLFPPDARGEPSIDQLKQTILQLAVMGKLVPQDPNDEPAAKLLERIAAEKAQLVKEGKIKKQKPLPPIADDEKPYELPEGWEWCRIGNASLMTDYGLSSKTSKDTQGVPVLKMGDIQSSQVVLGGQQTVPEATEGLPDLFLESRDILYNRTNSAELVGKTGIFLGPNNKYSYASYLIRVRTLKDTLLPEFINMNMASPVFRKTQIIPHLKQQCGQANVNGTIMKNMLVAIAPEAELERVIVKINQLMTLCDQIKTHLQHQQQTRLHLADAMVAQALNPTNPNSPTQPKATNL